MAIPNDDKPSFQQIIRDILEIPGVFKKDIAAWAEVDASTVTRPRGCERSADASDQPAPLGRGRPKYLASSIPPLGAGSLPVPAQPLKPLESLG